MAGLILGSAVALLLSAHLQAASFTTSLDRDTLTLGESATLSLTFEGGEPQGTPSLPAIANLQFTYVGPSSQFSIVNGRSSSSVTHVFTVTPRQPGSFVIPALQVTMGGSVLTSQPLRLTVLKAQTTGDNPASNQLAFLRMLVPKKEVYVGEVFTIEVQLCLRDAVRNIGNVQLTPPKADSFTVLKSTQLQQRRTMVGNNVITVVPVVYALAAVKPGAVTLGPVDCSLVVELAGTRARRRDFFDPFGMFEPTEQRPVNASAEAQTLQVLPLPATNVPPSFNGAVGSYTMTFSAGPTNVAVGDPITVKVQFTGRGVLDALTLPEQATWKNFKTYPTTAKVETSDQLGLQGTKAFEQVIVPQSADIKEVPGLEFSFFDPDLRSYRTLKQPTVALTVRPGSATPAPVIAAGKPSATEAPPPAQDIVGIKQHFGTVVLTQAPLALRPGFWTLNATPLLAWLAAVVWRKRTDALANNPRRRRRKQVAQIVNDGLQELRKLGGEKKSDEFFAALFRLLQEQIGERLDLPASAITEAIVDERLKPAGLADGTCAALHELFQASNLARYAPVQTSQELAALVPRLEAAIQELRRIGE